MERTIVLRAFFVSICFHFVFVLFSVVAFWVILRRPFSRRHALARELFSACHETVGTFMPR